MDDLFIREMETGFYISLVSGMLGCNQCQDMEVPVSCLFLDHCVDTGTPPFGLVPESKVLESHDRSILT